MSLLYGGRALFKCRREGGRSGKSGNGFDVVMMGAIIYYHFVHLEDIFQKINLNTFFKKYNFNKYGNLKTISWNTFRTTKVTICVLASFGSHTLTKCLLIYYYLLLLMVWLFISDCFLFYVCFQATSNKIISVFRHCVHMYVCNFRNTNLKYSNVTFCITILVHQYRFYFTQTH